MCPFSHGCMQRSLMTDSCRQTSRGASFFHELLCKERVCLPASRQVMPACPFFFSAACVCETLVNARFWRTKHGGHVPLSLPASSVLVTISIDAVVQIWFADRCSLAGISILLLALSSRKPLQTIFCFHSSSLSAGWLLCRGWQRRGCSALLRPDSGSSVALLLLPRVSG